MLACDAGVGLVFQNRWWWYYVLCVVSPSIRFECDPRERLLDRTAINRSPCGSLGVGSRGVQIPSCWHVVATRTETKYSWAPVVVVLVFWSNLCFGAPDPEPAPPLVLVLENIDPRGGQRYSHIYIHIYSLQDENCRMDFYTFGPLVVSIKY